MSRSDVKNSDFGIPILIDESSVRLVEVYVSARVWFYLIILGIIIAANNMDESLKAKDGFNEFSLSICV